MNQKLIWALSLIALCVLFFISTSGNTTVEIFSLKQKMPTALALLGFTGIGIAIGTLLK
jgi:hypothetical protein